jgi:hypothetical protein
MNGVQLILSQMPLTILLRQRQHLMKRQWMLARSDSLNPWRARQHC